MMWSFIHCSGSSTLHITVLTILFSIAVPPLPLGLPLEFSVEEDSTGSRLGLGLIGHSEGVVQFTVTPMTYQQFETATGTLVSSLPRATIPPPALLGKISGCVNTNSTELSFAVDISSNAAQTYTFGPNPPTNPRLAADFVFDVASAVVDDSIGEGDEGFILLLELDESNIDVVTITNGVTLVTIQDNDCENCRTFELSSDECFFHRRSINWCTTRALSGRGLHRVISVWCFGPLKRYSQVLPHSTDLSAVRDYH